MIGYEKPDFSLDADGVLKNSYIKRKTKKPTKSVIGMTSLKGTHDFLKR
jgi:hypothetical protein